MARWKGILARWCFQGSFTSVICVPCGGNRQSWAELLSLIKRGCITSTWWWLRVSRERWAFTPSSPTLKAKSYLFARRFPNLPLAWRMVYSYQLLWAWIIVQTQHVPCALSHAGIACVQNISVALTAWHMLQKLQKWQSCNKASWEDKQLISSKQ